MPSGENSAPCEFASETPFTKGGLVMVSNFIALDSIPVLLSKSYSSTVRYGKVAATFRPLGENLCTPL